MILLLLTLKQSFTFIFHVTIWSNKLIPVGQINLSIGISWYVDSILKYFICKNDFCTICIKKFVDINYLLFIKIFQMSLDERLEIIFAVTELLFFFFIKNKSKRKYKWKIQFSLDFRFNRLSQSMIQLCKFLKIDLHSHPPLQVLG